ncbi:LacI family DNA-binding transcriptional regulator [Paenibacillus sp. N3.4]|uniref:LacI family DNA-binding transcriptional regulator n=1 Tax=Paenibacillus sp. N3.4 TaxID=2603222 RepID=UPI0011CBB9F3|nr:LacI family DNA-binding transcriptional regulator [Paenibacillus sp. N3.4]TXK83797.1 LacI family transcriptional regulator [Paenibacillus sp. N3.4]
MKTTIKQVAKEAGVSTATVSRALTGSGFVSEDVKVLVMAAVDKLHYQPNAVARSLKQDKTKTIGVIIPDISNPFFMTVSKGIEDSVHGEGYNLLFASSDEDPQKEEELLHLLQEKRVDALILASAGGNDERILKMAQFGTPVILLDRLPGGLDGMLDIVAEDNFQVAYELTQSVLNKGHRRIGAINGFLDVSTGAGRYQGFLQAIADAGLPVEEQLVFDGEFSVDGGCKAVEYFMQNPYQPTAIISFNNKMSFGALQGLIQYGIKLPDDMMLASYGVVDAALLLHNPGIVYASQQPYEMGQRTGDLLLKRLQETDLQLYPPQNIIYRPVIQWMDESSNNEQGGRL